MSLFKTDVKLSKKPETQHPWQKTIKNDYSTKLKYAHNSVKNPCYPEPKKKALAHDRVRFTVIGNRLTKDFLYCVNLVQGLHKYRSKSFEAPIIRGISAIDWPYLLNELKLKYGGVVFCPKNVIILYNDKFLGGPEDLRELVETRYLYYVRLNYVKDCVAEFSKFVKSTGRSFAYMHFTVNDEYIGCMIFMGSRMMYSTVERHTYYWIRIVSAVTATVIPPARAGDSDLSCVVATKCNSSLFKLYSDIVPRTCENFLRLCTSKKGGYGGTPVHRIVKDGWIQCGGFGLKSVEMDCENFIVPFDKRGVIAMANDGRHLDCSTQFFVLLQPCTWITNRYVAFGQLVDGENTLKKIEEVKTYYEAPLAKIIISGAGILNLDCQDIMINRGANEYIDGHIEDLVTIGEIFTEELMMQVFLEIEFRRIARLEQLAEGEDGQYDKEKADIRATQRFLSKKEDIEKRIQKSHAASVTSGGKDNNDFDVEDYVYEPEEYSYSHVSPSHSLPPKEKKLYYLPLTDVKYPDEVDSDFDLKKFVRGNYCLETDLDPNEPKRKIRDLNLYDTLQDALSQFDFVEEEVEEESSVELDSDDEREINTYVTFNSDHASFGGKIIANIAKSYGTSDLLELFNSTKLITDEELRRIRKAMSDFQAIGKKKVSITAPPPSLSKHAKIKRRQTGYIRPEDIKNLKEQEVDDAEDEDVSYTPQPLETRKISVAIKEPVGDDDDEVDKKGKGKRRQTGFVRTEDLEKVHVFDKPSADDFMAKNEPHGRLSQGRLSQGHPSAGKPRPSILGRKSSATEIRQSVMIRLYEDVAPNTGDSLPKLKDYKPAAEMHQKNMLLTMSHGLTEVKESEVDRNLPRASIAYEASSLEEIQHKEPGKKVHRVSSDFINPLDKEQKPGSSIRSVEYSKSRPTLTISEYQKKNQMQEAQP